MIADAMGHYSLPYYFTSPASPTTIFSSLIRVYSARCIGRLRICIAMPASLIIYIFAFWLRASISLLFSIPKSIAYFIFWEIIFICYLFFALLPNFGQYWCIELAFWYRHIDITYLFLAQAQLPLPRFSITYDYFSRPPLKARRILLLIHCTLLILYFGDLMLFLYSSSALYFRSF